MTESRPNEEPAWTIAKVLQWATGDFRGRGLESPRLDAEVLLAHVLGLERLQLILQSDRPLTAGELAVYKQAIVRRRGAEPVCYITGRKEFYGLDFRVDKRVLAPRPDTETLVTVALDRTEQRGAFGEVLDLCTGSGCVAVALAKARPAWVHVGADISLEALSVARHNAERNNVVHNLRFIHSDLFQDISSLRPFDLITANPPYIPSSEIAELAPDIREHEPRLALDGGEDGLSVVGKIVQQAPQHLADGGVLAMEIGFGQAPAVVALFERAGFVATQAQRDYGNVERVVSGRWVSPR